MKELLEEAKAYSVSLYPWEIKKLEEQQGLHTLCDGSVTVLQEGYYNDDFGFVIDQEMKEFLGV